jgi:hypothetical protein
MNTQALILWLVLILLAVIAGLVWLAVAGYIIGYILLAILGTVLLVGLGEVFSIIRDKIAAQRQQQAFMDNAQENLSIMQTLQGIQNQQNTALLKQLGQVSRLPQQQSNTQGVLLIEDGIFDELE